MEKWPIQIFSTWLPLLQAACNLYIILGRFYVNFFLAEFSFIFQAKTTHFSSPVSKLFVW